MRTFSAAILLDSLDLLNSDAYERVSPALYDWHMDRVDCVDDLADAVSSGVSGSLLAAYVVAVGTGIPVEYVLPCETQVLATAPLECLTARDANPASR
jgi:hypothetical protein